MLFLNTVAALALVAGTAVQAKNWDVAVGANGTVFDPPSITGAADADVVIFTFKGGAHTVTQSTFANPCSPLSGGVDSGPKPVEGAATPPTFNYTVSSANATWFFCATGTHCSKGAMVFAINPTADKTYDAFKAAATGGGGNGTASSSPSGTASGSTAPAATSKAAANGRAAVGVGAVAAALLFGGVNAL